MGLPVSNRFPPELSGSLARWAIAAIVAFFLANYAYHYGVLPESIRHSEVGYFFSVQLPFGLVLPSTLLGLRVRQSSSSLSTIGVWLSARDAIGALAALVVGGLMVVLALAAQRFTPQELIRAGGLFAQLLVASAAEVLVFTALLLGLAREWCRGLGSWTLPVAVLISALGFGVFHFTYPPPWATWGFALGLAVVWAAVTAVFLITRTLLGAIVFNNCMALIGFLQNDLTLPISVPLSLAMSFVDSQHCATRQGWSERSQVMR